MLLQATGKNTFFGKTASLLQQNDEMGHLQVCMHCIMSLAPQLELLNIENSMSATMMKFVVDNLLLSNYPCAPA